MSQMSIGVTQQQAQTISQQQLPIVGTQTASQMPFGVTQQQAQTITQQQLASQAVVTSPESRFPSLTPYLWVPTPLPDVQSNIQTFQTYQSKIMKYFEDLKRTDSVTLFSLAQEILNVTSQVQQLSVKMDEIDNEFFKLQSEKLKPSEIATHSNKNKYLRKYLNKKISQQKISCEKKQSIS